MVVGETGGEEADERGWHHFHAVFFQPVDNELVAKAVVLDVNFAHQPDDRHLLLGVDGFGEFRHRRTQQLLETFAVVGFDDGQSLFGVLLPECRGPPFLPLAHNGGMVQLGEAVGVKDRAGGDIDDPPEGDRKPRLCGTDGCAERQGYNGNILKTSGNHRVLDEGIVVGGAALSARLRHDDGHVHRVVVAAFQGVHDGADDERGGVAHLVVGILQSSFGSLGRAGRQGDEPVARQFEEGGEELGVPFGEVGTEQGAAALLFGESACGDVWGGCGGTIAAAARRRDGLDQRPHAQPQRADVVHVVDFQHCVVLVVPFQDGADLVEDEGVGAAAEGGELHQMEVGIGAVANEVGGLEDAVGVAPLGDGVQFVVNTRARCGRHILGDNVDAHVGDGVRDLVLDERVDMVGTGGEQNHHAVLVDGGGEDLVGAAGELRKIVVLRLYRRLHRRFCRCRGNAQRFQVGKAGF